MFEEYLKSHSLRLKKARTPFPRAAERAKWEAVRERAALVKWGEEALSGYPMRTATAFLAFTRTGDRKADEGPYFRRRSLLMGAALAECVEHEGRLMDAVIDGLWCILEETSWVICAHNGSSHEGARPAREHPLPDAENPYIDLFAAQTAATVAYTLYLLGDELDAVTPMIKRRALLELERRVIHPFLTHDDFWWMGFMRRGLNNWTPWILSNLIDTMLLTVSDETVLKQGLARAMRMLDKYLSALPEDGGCDEGVGYWNVAGGSLLDCLESLRFACGLDFYRDPLVKALGAYPVNAHIAGDWFWNFADCDAQPILDGERLYTYGLRTKNEALKALGERVFARRPAFPPRDTPQMNRVLYALFTPVPAPEGAEAENRTVCLPKLQAFAFERGGMYAAIKGGHNQESHNHNDVGAFILYQDGAPCVVDAGNMVYTAKTFGPERYTLWNTQSKNHNLPLIGGFGQRAGRDAAAADVRAWESGASMELAAAYEKAAGVVSLKRLLVNDGAVTLTDEITLKKAAAVTWVFLLREKPEQTKPGALRTGKTTLSFDPKLTYRAEEYPVTDARMLNSFPGSLWRVTLTDESQKTHAQTFIFSRS